MLDRIDWAIAKILRQNARSSTKKIAAALLAAGIRMSERGVALRIEKLQNNGVITGFTISADPKKLGLPVARIALIKFRMAKHFLGRIEEFKKYLIRAPHCVFACRTRGEIDWINVMSFPSEESADFESDWFRENFSDIIADYKAYNIDSIRKESTAFYTDIELKGFLLDWAKRSPKP